MSRRRTEIKFLRLGPLSAGELDQRRAEARRRRQRRRGVIVTVLALLCAGGVALVALGTGSDSRARPGSPRRLARTKGPGPVRPASRRPPAKLAATKQLAPPTPPGDAGIERLLAHSGYLRLGGTAAREVALTFDDGPSPYTARILEVLEHTGTPATFFTIGRSVSQYPSLVAREAHDGFAVGDHTETHAFLSMYGSGIQTMQIEHAAAAIQAAGAPAPRLFRPPYGAFNATTLSILHTLGLAMVLWSVDTKDYARPGVQRIIDTAVSGAQPGAVILMHDGGGDRSETANALPRIIELLRGRGYKLVTVAQLLIDDPPPDQQPPPRPLSGVP